MLMRISSPSSKGDRLHVGSVAGCIDSGEELLLTSPFGCLAFTPCKVTWSRDCDLDSSVGASSVGIPGALGGDLEFRAVVIVFLTAFPSFPFGRSFVAHHSVLTFGSATRFICRRSWLARYKFVELDRFFFIFLNKIETRSSPFHCNSFMRLYFKCCGRIVFILVSQVHLREQIFGQPRSRKLLLSMHLFLFKFGIFFECKIVCIFH